MYQWVEDKHDLKDVPPSHLGCVLDPGLYAHPLWVLCVYIKILAFVHHEALPITAKGSTPDTDFDGVHAKIDAERIHKFHQLFGNPDPLILIDFKLEPVFKSVTWTPLFSGSPAVG